MDSQRLMEKLSQIERDLEILGKQRAFFAASLAVFLDRPSDDPDMVRVKAAISQAFIDRICEQDLLLHDPVEKNVLESIRDFMDTENALSRVKQDLDDESSPL